MSIDSESDRSSNRSEASYRLALDDLSEDEDELVPSTGIWESVHDTITSLRQLGATLRRAGVRHRQQRVARFASLDRNKEQYEMFERLAYQKAAHTFPNASPALHKRIAESIAMRRCRFLYLERHQMKARISTDVLATDPPNNVLFPEVVHRESTAAEDFQQPKDPIYSTINESTPTVNQQTELSKTVATELDFRPYAESVASVQVTMGAFPPLPTIDESTMSFTCQYCYLVCPATESSNETAWKNHLVHDLEPFFCIFESCKDAFGHGDSFSSWLTHVQNAHAQRHWYCWYCQSASMTTALFASPSDLEDHLITNHIENANEVLLSTIINHSLVRNRPLSTECPFCGGYPDELEKAYPDRESKAAVEGLIKHIKLHLITISLFLLPINSTNAETAEVDELATETGTRNGTIPDTDGLELLDGLTTVRELQCSNYDCDCRINNSIPSGDWIRFTEMVKLSDSAGLFTHKNLTVSEPNDEGWDFWFWDLLIHSSSDVPRSKFPDIEDDAKLKEYFRMAPLTTHNDNQDKNSQDVATSVPDELQLLQSLQATSLNVRVASDWKHRDDCHGARDISNDIFEHEKFQNWVAGDTIVLAITSQQSEMVTTHDIIPIDALAGLSICYYSFSYEGKENMTEALRSILYQLLNQQRHLLQYATAIRLKNPRTWSYSFESLSAIFIMAISDPACQLIRVIFDNINDCSEKDLFNNWFYDRLMASLTNISRVKYLFTCWNHDQFLYKCRHNLYFSAFSTIDVYTDPAMKHIIILPDDKTSLPSPGPAGMLSNDEDIGISRSRSDLIETFRPDIEGFQKYILSLNPSLGGHGSYLIDRLAHFQFIRYKQLLANIVRHLRVGADCPSGSLCIARGGGAISVDQRGKSKAVNNPDMVFDSSEDDELVEGPIKQETFAAGIPMPPTQTLPAEFECPHCFSVKKFQKPLDWTKHVHEDVQTFTCTWPGCREPRTFKRKADWARHENEGHRQLEWWVCDVEECRHICYRRDNFMQHLVREHRFIVPLVSPAESDNIGFFRSTWERVNQCHRKTHRRPQDEACRFCGRRLTTWESLIDHLAKHLEQIALPVVRLVAAKSEGLTADTIIDVHGRFPLEPIVRVGATFPRLP